MRYFQKILLLFIGHTVITGCNTLQQANEHAVSTTIESREHKQVYWNQGNCCNEQINLINILIDDTLSVDTAVKILQGL